MFKLIPFPKERFCVFDANTNLVISRKLKLEDALDLIRYLNGGEMHSGFAGYMKEMLVDYKGKEVQSESS